MKKKMLSILIIFTLLNSFVSVNSVKAETIMDQSSGEIVFNEFDTLSVKYNEATVVKLVLKEAGSFVIDFRPSSMLISSLYLYDEVGNLLSNDINRYADSYSSISNKSFGHSDDLEAGTYYLRYWHNSSSSDTLIECTYYATFYPSKKAELEIIPTIKVGEELNLSTALTNSKDKKITWKTSSSKIASVSDKGVVEGKKKGTVTIKAYNKEGVLAKIKIKIVK